MLSKILFLGRYRKSYKSNIEREKRNKIKNIIILHNTIHYNTLLLLTFFINNNNNWDI